MEERFWKRKQYNILLPLFRCLQNIDLITEKLQLNIT